MCPIFHIDDRNVTIEDWKVVSCGMSRDSLRQVGFPPIKIEEDFASVGLILVKAGPRQPGRLPNAPPDPAPVPGPKDHQRFPDDIGNGDKTEF